MRVHYTVWVTAFVLLTNAFAVAEPSDPKLDAPPPGLVPSTARVADVLASHAKALGRRTPGVPDTAIEDWTFTDSGITGSEHLERSGTDYHSKILRGPFVEEYGQLNGVRWHRDFNGIVSPTTGVEDDSFYAQRIIEDAADPKNDIALAGETTGPHPAYVVKVTVSGRTHPEWIFYDKSTSMIVRVESAPGKRRIVSTYDDFRTTNGLAQFWHVHDSDGRPELDDDWQQTSLTNGGGVAAAQFSQPASDGNFEGLGARATIPTHDYSGTFVMRVNVAGRGLDFIFDPSSPYSIVDHEVAVELNLPTYGQATQLANGKSVSFDTILPDATVGPIRLQHFAVKAEDYNYDFTNDTKIVGVLGYDFLATNVFKVDFLNGTVDVIPPKDMATIHNGLDVGLTVDGNVPFVTMGLGTDQSSRVVFDPTSLFTMIFGSYYHGHEADFTDLHGKALADSTIPFADEGTYGVQYHVWWADISHIHFANGDLQKAIVAVTNEPLGDDDTRIDAVVGYDNLQYYDIYYAYPYGQIMIAPNAWFFAQFKPTK
jgi:hypothetical protein